MVDDSGTPASSEVTLDPVPDTPSRNPRALWGVLAVIAVVTGAVVAISGGGDGDRSRLPVSLGAWSAHEGAGVAADMSLAAWVTYIAGDELPALGGEGPAYKLAGSVDEAAVRRLAAALGLDAEPQREDRTWRVIADSQVLEVYEDAGGSWWYSLGVDGGTVSSGSAEEPCVGGPATDCGPVDLGECAPEADCLEPAPRPVPAPQPPANLPSEGEARTIALDLLSATGMDLTDAKITVDGPHDAWYVSVEPVVDGLPVSGWVSSVSVGANGTITNASGTLAAPELVGEYPLVDTRAAIDRLNAQQGGFGGGPVPLGIADDDVVTDARGLDEEAAARCREDGSCAEAGAIAGSAPTTTEVQQCKTQPDGSEICEAIGVPVPPIDCYVPIPPVAEPGTAPGEGAPDAGVSHTVTDCFPPDVCHEQVVPSAGGGTDATALIDCFPTEPVPEPEPVDVVLTTAERVLVLLPAIDGSGDSYLLTGYRFSSSDGAIVEVAAVDDDSLAPTPEGDEPAEPGAPPAEDPVVLEPGATPEVGVGYYVEVAVTHCPEIIFDDRRWVPADVFDPSGWSTPTEGGTFTLSSPDEGEFVGDLEGTKRARFVAHGPSDEPVNCA